MSKSIPINPDILRWARETAGKEIDQVVKDLKRKTITKETIESWENGSDSPSYPQLKDLAYKVYKRPIAIFFFPKPPEEKTPKQSFRTLPEYEIDQLPSQLLFLIREARVLQMNLADLFDNQNPAPKNIVQDLSFGPNVSLKKLAETVRKYLDVDLSRQLSWKDTDEALKEWRNTFENSGVFVFKAPFKLIEFSGFCLYDENFPLIYVDNSKPPTRQIFTLFHELAHLLFHTGGIDTRKDDYLKNLEGKNRTIETYCNGFAGEFLVPDKDFEHRISGISLNDETIQILSQKYKVSREVILRKLKDKNLISETAYEERVKRWERETQKQEGKGGNYYLNQKTYLGDRYIDQVFSQYFQKKISIEQAADYLRVNVKNMPGMESLLSRKEAAA